MTLSVSSRYLPGEFSALTTMAVILALASVPLLAAMLLDSRQIDGDSIWLKPLKFHAALAIYLVTLAFFARYLPAGLTDGRGWRAYQTIVLGCIAAEVIWIGAAAALGTTSHFNVSSPVWAAVYPLMGLAAVTLTSMSLAMGIAIWRNPATGLAPALQLSIALGLILTFALTVITAGYMSNTTGHYVGTPLTGAKLPVLGWSTEVGELRAPHFLATHALHGVPLVGWLATLILPGTWAIPTVWLAALAYAALVGLAFARSLAGLPLI